MGIKLSDCASHAASQAKLAAWYRETGVPAEKKPFVIDLYRSNGPFLAIDHDDVVILDAASQIATLGLGLNHSALFGTAQHLSGWIGDTHSHEFQRLRNAFEKLLLRQLRAPEYSIAFCHSGAEAIEIALAACFARRTIPSADRVLAFVGAFHGRTKFALETTWSPEKREPFSWQQNAAEFVPYPECDESDPRLPSVPPGWDALWSTKQPGEFAEGLRRLGDVREPLLAREIESLTAVRAALAASRVFAILIEPMQSEGGDRYSSRRFHLGLAALSRTFETPLIYDEIQTGLHLGRSFFWHQQFGLELRGEPWLPDFVVTAKKSQVGVVLSRFPLPPTPEVCAVSLIRGYIQASMLDQFSEEIAEIERGTQSRLEPLVAKHTPTIARPRSQGLAFAFDFRDAETLQQAIALRFEFGLLFYSAGSRTARFRLSLAFRDREIDLLFSRLDALLARVANPSQPKVPLEVELESAARHFSFHDQWLNKKWTACQNQSRPETDLLAQLSAHLREFGAQDPDVHVRILDRHSFPQFRDRILQIQTEIYEPARQTPGEDFDRVFAAPQPLALIVEKNGTIMGMAFAGRLMDFCGVSGVASDAERTREDAAYMVDTTVMPPHRGYLGRYLKQSLVLLALARGYRTIHGRNRDHLARGMWAINLSLGSYVTNHLVHDYEDQEAYRDCLYYRCPLTWEVPIAHLSRGVEAPFGWTDLSPQFWQTQLPQVVNKLTLSNFVDSEYLKNLRAAMELFPPGLRHGYSASGISEATDKIVKSIWRHRAPRQRLLTFDGHVFGSGTLLSRCLSGWTEGPFAVTRLQPPALPDDDRRFEELEAALRGDDFLAMFVEPLPSQSLTPLSIEVLRRIRVLCGQYSVPLVFHESSAMFFRHQSDHFVPSWVPGCEPDASVASLGGQMALALLRPKLFDSTPLQIISTWDGDGFSLAQFVAAAAPVIRDRASFLQLQEEFAAALLDKLGSTASIQSELRRGCGWIDGELPASWEARLRRSAAGRFLICPSPSAMREFIAECRGT